MQSCFAIPLSSLHPTMQMSHAMFEGATRPALAFVDTACRTGCACVGSLILNSVRRRRGMIGMTICCPTWATASR
jgi:hypothetical protein